MSKDVTSNVKFTTINIGSLSMNKFWGETERVRSATATCTLLEVGGKRLLVDPSPGPELLAPMLFDTAGVRPEQIDQVFLTHYHGDHRYGLELFAGKQWLMAAAGLEDWKQRSPQDAASIDQFSTAEGKLPDGVSLLHSPGHLPGHQSLLVNTKWGLAVVTGDAVMTPEFFEAEEGYHNSVDFEVAAATIRKIKGMADLVIPGHGNFFLNLR